jgi:hypothetical protein
MSTDATMTGTSGTMTTGTPIQEIFYYRYSFQPRTSQSRCDVQLFALPDQTLIAYAVHGCGYSRPNLDWKLGKSSLADIGPPIGPTQTRFISDAKFQTYVEKHYFGRGGGYADYYFAVNYKTLELDPATLRHIDSRRGTLVLQAVVVSKNPGDVAQGIDQKRWDEFFARVAGVDVTWFE